MHTHVYVLNILAKMQPIEILSLGVTVLCLVSFCAVFTILFRNYYKHTISDITEGKDDIELIDNALYEEQQSKSKARKVWRIIRKVLSWTIFGLVVVGFGFSLTSRFTNNTMMIGDTAHIVIATGSMQEKNSANSYLEEFDLNNQIKTYDMVEIQKVESADQIKLYDVIAFKDKDERTIVHRVIEIKADGTFITRGDSNAVSDNGNLYGDSLPFDKVVGRYTGSRVPLIGLFVIFLQSNAGIITIVSVVYCMFMFDFYRTKYEKAIDSRTGMLIDLINYDMSHEEADDVFTHFRELIVYKGETYIFEHGKFVSKDDKIPEQANNCKDDEMIVIKQDNGNEEIEVRNVKNNNIEDKNLNNSSKSE